MPSSVVRAGHGAEGFEAEAVRLEKALAADGGERVAGRQRAVGRERSDLASEAAAREVPTLASTRSMRAERRPGSLG